MQAKSHPLTRLAGTLDQIKEPLNQTKSKQACRNVVQRLSGLSGAPVDLPMEEYLRAGYPPDPWTLRLTTLNPAPVGEILKPCTLRPLTFLWRSFSVRGMCAGYVRNPQPSTLNPEPYALNPHPAG